MIDIFWIWIIISVIIFTETLFVLFVKLDSNDELPFFAKKLFAIILGGCLTGLKQSIFLSTNNIDMSEVILKEVLIYEAWIFGGIFAIAAFIGLNYLLYKMIKG